jgi:hypothetical protein
MSISRSAVVGLSVSLLLISLIGAVTPVMATRTSQSSAANGVQLALSAAHSTQSWDERDPGRQKFELPLLYLHHERQATDAAEQTLTLQIAGLAGGTALHFEAVSQHTHAYTGEPHTLNKRFVLPERPCTPADPCTLRWTFDPQTALSDLYTLRVRSEAGELLWSNPAPERPDFVILDTWDVGVGAYTVRLFYAVLFPYARDINRLDYRLPPEAVPDFIENRMVPMILETWQAQMEGWGFGDPIHPDWDADRVVEVIITSPPFALFDGTGTYTVLADAQGRPYPERRIWWLSTHPAFGRYDSWENAHRVIFAHEFFHLAQWNVLLSAGQAGTGQPINYWKNTFIEAQAEFAVGVQYPELELGKSHVLAGSSAYGNSANLFLMERLNASYRDLEAGPTSKYDLALYWRFLYEQYGGMDVIRAALEEMVQHHDPDILAGLEPTLDAALARVPGPFHSFQESLVAFARANYALRLDAESQGRCAAVDFAECGGRYYDPDERYLEPPLAAKLAYDGVTLAHAGTIPTSYGMDFVEVRLDPALQSQPLQISFQGKGTVARFNVQVWKVRSGPRKPRAVTEQPAVMAPSSDGARVYSIANLDTETYDRLVLIITRLDADEARDPAGDYAIVLDARGE